MYKNPFHANDVTNLDVGFLFSY